MREKTEQVTGEGTAARVATFLTRDDRNVGAGTFDSVRWAIEEHLKENDTGEFNSAVLYGNEDCPTEILFYAEAKPNWNTPEARLWIARSETARKLAEAQEALAVAQSQIVNHDAMLEQVRLIERSKSKATIADLLAALRECIPSQDALNCADPAAHGAWALNELHYRAGIARAAIAKAERGAA
jgi:hypothetical protein